MRNDDDILADEGAPTDDELREAEELARVLEGQGDAGTLASEVAATASFLRAHREGEDGPSLEADPQRLHEIGREVWARGPKRRWRLPWPRLAIGMGALGAVGMAAMLLLVVPLRSSAPLVASESVAVVSETPAEARAAPPRTDGLPRPPVELLDAQKEVLADSARDLEPLRKHMRVHRQRFLGHLSDKHRRHAAREELRLWRVVTR